ncbi:class I SAM-dependent methyltransferase [Streptomyces griseofuscus]|uniref:class I SAM-dependent methyltransferase n=1 Tax=Streptomyces griseofuscus TaxID=146922 RepID=UPI003455BA96
MRGRETTHGQAPRPRQGRPALDIGSGDGSLARYLHHELGYRTTGIDCSPSAVELAAAHDINPGPSPGPAWQCVDITTDDVTVLAHPAYALITCRLVYRWIDDKPAFLDQIRRILALGGVFWVVTEIAGRRIANRTREVCALYGHTCSGPGAFRQEVTPWTRW